MSRVSELGSLVRLELVQAAGGDIAEVEMTRERYAADPLQIGDLVFVKPRQVRVFLQNSDASTTPPLQWGGDGDGI